MATEKRLIDANRLAKIAETRCGVVNIKHINDCPTVDAVEVVHGRWEHKKHKLFGNTYDYVCSACGCDYALAEYNYCPNCGAMMDGGSHETD